MIPVLDHGFVDIVSATPSTVQLYSLVTNFNRGAWHPKFLKIPTMVLRIKCPLFVQLWLSESQISLITAKTDDEPVAYVPTVAEIGCPDLKTSEIIQNNISQTAEALMLNPKAYQTDSCDRFISQVNSPVSVYNTLVAYGNLETWLEVTNQRGLPKPIEAYRKAIHDCAATEWTDIRQWSAKK